MTTSTFCYIPCYMCHSDHCFCLPEIFRRYFRLCASLCGFRLLWMRGLCSICSCGRWRRIISTGPSLRICESSERPLAICKQRQASLLANGSLCSEEAKIGSIMLSWSPVGRSGRLINLTWTPSVAFMRSVRDEGRGGALTDRRTFIAAHLGSRQGGLCFCLDSSHGIMTRRLKYAGK